MKLLNVERLNDNINNVAKYDFDNKKVFGSAYMVVQNGEVLLNKCFGYTSVDSKNPVTDKTIFRLASMTKPITAIAILILVERGLLSLSDTVTKFLPEFKNQRLSKIDEDGNVVTLEEVKNDITILNLLTHTSGFGSDYTKLAKLTENDKETIDKSIAFYLNIGMDYEPGTKQQYSGTLAFDVLVKIIEMITKTDYLSFITKEIFEPCGMVDTTFIPSSEQWARFIDIHNRIDGENVVHKSKENCVFFDYPCTHFLGGAGLASTISDYTKFALMLLNEGKTETKQIISKDTLKLMRTPHVPEEIMPGNERWGLGVRVIVNEEYKNLPVGTFGWSGAYGSHFWVDIDNKVVAVYMKNSMIDPGAANESARFFESAVNESFV